MGVLKRRATGRVKATFDWQTPGKGHVPLLSDPHMSSECK